MSAAGMDIVKQQERIEEADTELKFQDFRWTEEKARDDAMRNVEAGQAATFADDWSTGIAAHAGRCLVKARQPER
jgi:hypothetical protein